MRDTRRTTATRPLTPEHGDERALCAVEMAEAPYFRAVMAPVREDRGGVAVGAAAWELLGLREGAGVTVLGIE